MAEVSVTFSARPLQGVATLSKAEGRVESPPAWRRICRWFQWKEALDVAWKLAVICGAAKGFWHS